MAEPTSCCAMPTEAMNALIKKVERVGHGSETSRTTGSAYCCTAASTGTLTQQPRSEGAYHGWLRRATYPAVLDASQWRVPDGNLDPLPPRLVCTSTERKHRGVSAEDDFTEYVAAHWPRLVGSAVLLGCAPAEAEDLVQTALERCLVKWGNVMRADDRDAYVHRVLINSFTSSRRRRWTNEHPTADLPHPPGPDETARVEDTDAVSRALDQLTADQRTAVVLRYYAHLSEQQMASVLGVAPGTVKSRLSRAIKMLAQDPRMAELRGT